MCVRVCVCVCVCVCVHLGGWGCANQPEYHHLANIGAEEIKILKVTEQFHQDNDATINWTDNGSDNSESYNNALLQSISLWGFVKDCVKKQMLHDCIVKAFVTLIFLFLYFNGLTDFGFCNDRRCSNQLYRHK